jgi:hypothetical protein
MHGLIGDRNSRIESRGDLDFYYRTRAALLDARRLGSDCIDYDFYRARAREERNRARRETFRWLRRFIRPLAAIAIIAAAIWIMPVQENNCTACDAQAVHADDAPTLTTIH